MRILLTLGFFVLLSQLTAQTCCSGGVPLAGNLGLPAAEAGSWQLALSYDYNRLRRLYTGSEALEETSRTRTTQTALLELSYTINDRWAIDALVPYINQRRIIQRQNVSIDETSGLGDVVLLLRYNWFKTDPGRSWQWSSGIGVKLPNGAANRENAFGIAYNADLQPGSAAWDLVWWNRISHQVAFRPSLSIFLNAVHRIRGVNDDYLPFVNTAGERISQAYQFGEETQFTLGVSDRIYNFGLLIDPGLSLLLRHARPDKTNNVVTPSTGGTFMFVQPSLGLELWPNIHWQVAVDLPLYTRVVGTQVAPTLRLNTGVRFLLPAK